MWGNPLQNSGYLLQLVKLIPRQPNKINIKKSSVGEPLAKFRLLSSVAPPPLDCLRRPIAKENIWITGILLSVVDCCGKRLYTNWNHRNNYFGFVVNRVENIKHWDHVFQKFIGHYYRKIVKEGINDMGTEPNRVNKAITPFIAKKDTDTVNKTEKSQASKRKKIYPAAINLKKVNHWINKGLLK